VSYATAYCDHCARIEPIDSAKAREQVEHRGEVIAKQMLATFGCGHQKKIVMSITNAARLRLVVGG